MSQWSKATSDQEWENYFCAVRKMSFLLLSQDCHSARAQVRPHRYRRTHRVPLRVQQDYKVTIPTLKHRETEAILYTPKTQIKRRATIEQRAVDCEMSKSGCRSSHKISNIQKCQHSQTLLLIQIRNILRKWQQGSTAFL